jgi:hypothetical protein
MVLKRFRMNIKPSVASPALVTGSVNLHLKDREYWGNFQFFHQHISYYKGKRI